MITQNNYEFFLFSAQSKYRHRKNLKSEFYDNGKLIFSLQLFREVKLRLFNVIQILKTYLFLKNR